MKKHTLKSLLLAFLISVSAISLLPAPTFAKTQCPETANNAVIKLYYEKDEKKECGINGILQLLVYTILPIIIGAAAVIGFVISGIMYATAAGDESKIKNAKQWIINIVIGLVVYGLISVIGQFLIPGGPF